MAGSSVIRKLFNRGKIWLFEASTNGASKVVIQAPESLSADLTITLPDANAVGFLSNDGNGVTSWSTMIRSGAGTPEGSVTAPPGTIYMNTSGGSGTTLYVKESGAGNTGWVGK